jgi:hypothetical protein
MWRDANRGVIRGFAGADAIVSPHHVEPLQILGGLVAGVNGLDSGARRTASAPFEHRGDRARRALEHRFDVAAIRVPHPAAESEISRALSTRGSEKHTLHSSGHTGMHTAHG